MPIERQRWLAVAAWDALNARLKRVVGVFDESLRRDLQTMTATGTLTLTYPRTTLTVDTTGGSATITLPPAASVPGFELVVIKSVAANTVTLDGAGSETISGAATLAWSTQWQTYTLTTNGTNWVIM
ncbi:baseplate wedge protein [Caudoviricetes sp.]|nr:baseplate wedge protein [Caudoviricetes sp.]